MKPPRMIGQNGYGTFCGCYSSHIQRYLPIPETPEEKKLVDAAEKRWDDEFWTWAHDLGDEKYSSVRDIPPWVMELMPRGNWPESAMVY